MACVVRQRVVFVEGHQHGSFIGGLFSDCRHFLFFGADATAFGHNVSAVVFYVFLVHRCHGKNSRMLAVTPLTVSSRASLPCLVV